MMQARHTERARKRMRRKDLLVLIDQLGMYVRAGLPADHALGTMKASLGARNVQRLERVSGAVRAGRTLSLALSGEFIIQAMILGLIESGESSGTLADALQACASVLERQDELIKRSASALVYPCVIGTATICLTVGLMEAIMPQIIPLLTGLHAKLPVLTRIVIWLSQAITRYWAYACVTSIGAGSSLMLFYRKNSRARRMMHSLVLRIPIIGGLVARHSLALFFGSLGSMIDTGVPLDEAYSRSLDSMGIMPIREAFDLRSDPLIRGAPASILADVPIPGMPRYAAPLLVAGENSGNLGDSMRRISSMIDRELEHALKRLTSLLEPAMMIGMGGMVGSIALAIMMPIYDISRALQK